MLTLTIVMLNRVVSKEEALEILSDFHGSRNKNNELVRLEFKEIKHQVQHKRDEGAKSYADLFERSVLRWVALGYSLQRWSQLPGTNAMVYYIIYVFQSAGLTGRCGNLIADSIQYVLNMLFTSTLRLTDPSLLHS